MTPKHSYPSQEIAQSVGTMPHEAEVTSSNPPSPSCVDMSKKKNLSYLTLLNYYLMRVSFINFFKIHFI